MTTPAQMRNSAAYFMPEGENADRDIADDTYLTGTIVDRQSFGNAQSAIACVGVHFKTAGGAGVATNTLTIEVLHDDAAAMDSTASLDTDTYVYTWAANGDNKGFHTLPIDLSSADRYIRVRAKLTEAGTITITEQCLTVGLLLGGMDQVPHSSYAAAGNEVTTEPSA